MKENLKTLFSFVILISLILGCSKLSDLTGDGADKLFFCESYDVSSDKCEGKSEKFTSGFLTVMIDLRPSKRVVGADKVNINVTDLKSGQVVDTFPYDTKSDMNYVYFDKVDFKNPGKYKVSALKPDGTVLVSNEIEIVDK